MTTITCDLCGVTIADRAATVQLLDGVNPVTEEQCYKTIDCCYLCLTNIPDLGAEVELNDMILKIRGRF